MKKKRVPKEGTSLFKPHWKRCVGTGRLGLALQKQYVEHLEAVQEAIGFDYIRGHGLFHDDVGIYREVRGEPFYNFTYMDQIIDTYLERGLRPFIEIGFMPKQLASGDQTIFYWKGHVTPPKDEKRWRELVQATVRHMLQRYGENEVAQWPFEIWNEPNLTNFWKDADQQAYFDLYNVTARAIKDVYPDLHVGGPAICGGSDHWITDFLNFCHRENVPVDFVSRHAYTSKPPKKRTPDYTYQDLHPNTDMLEQFKAVRERVDASPFPHLPLHITEYNTSYSPINPVHDTPLNAAYLARILSEGGDVVDSFSYWTFSDVFEESDVPRAPFHGGFGLMALNGIPKPTFHLFAFFNKLGEERLYRDEQVLVTRKADGSIALVAWHCVMESREREESHIELEIPIAASDVVIQRQSVNERDGHPFNAWKQMGRPRFPDRTLVNMLRRAAQPNVTTSGARVRDGRLSLSLRLTKNEVTLLEIVPVKDETDTYIGLDDRMIPSYS